MNVAAHWGLRWGSCVKVKALLRLTGRGCAALASGRLCCVRLLLLHLHEAA